MKSIKSVVQDNLCSGCGACVAICPKDAIAMTLTSIGQLKASVRKDLCIDCAICQKVCPSLDFHQTILPKDDDVYLGKTFHVYTGISTDPAIYKNAQSGGAVTSTLTYLFNSEKIDAAVVCERDFADSVHVAPKIVTHKSELRRSQKSNYTPVDMCSILRKTSTFKSIAFVGIPCQIQGVDKLMATHPKFQNIKYKIGIICDRTESEAFADCLKRHSKRNGKYQLITRFSSHHN